MADIIVSGKNRSRSHKVPRIDLTPMVDLGFLLITFFMYTTSLAKPKVMDLRMPAEGLPTAYIEEATITIIPTAAHRAIIYTGSSDNPVSLASCGFTGANSLRAQISEARKRAGGLPERFSEEAHQLHVIIKPDAASSYADLVRVLDEMLINEVQWYSFVQMDAADKLLVQTYGK